MQFDLFHSLGRIDSVKPRLDDRTSFAQFLSQVQLAEEIGLKTIWVAESHFSSEVQKGNSDPVIPNYLGEVGLNCDSMQLFQWVMGKTSEIGFGTAIFNIVGGNGGPIATADRVRTLAFLNDLSEKPRKLNIGIAAGRFPYINTPFGIVPRSDEERKYWSEYRRLIFLEALEIFLRLGDGATLSSEDVLQKTWLETAFTYKHRWTFEKLKLVPDLSERARVNLNYVLGSQCPLARELAFSICDVDVFNLSFTPPAQLNKIHEELSKRCKDIGRKAWDRSRLPRTVLVFVDMNRTKAKERASQCFDTYIEAMRGTAEVPDKNALMDRALIGSPEDICGQLSPQDAHGFQPNDRLMLWFEFNQSDNREILAQMKLFADEVMPQFAD